MIVCSQPMGCIWNTFVLQILGLGLFVMFMKTPLQGAQTTIYCAVSEEMEGVTGKYLADCKIAKTKNPQAEDDQLAERLWEVSERLTQSS